MEDARFVYRNAKDPQRAEDHQRAEDPRRAKNAGHSALFLKNGPLIDFIRTDGGVGPGRSETGDQQVKTVQFTGKTGADETNGEWRYELQYVVGKRPVIKWLSKQHIAELDKEQCCGGDDGLLRKLCSTFNITPNTLEAVQMREALWTAAHDASNMNTDAM